MQVYDSVEAGMLYAAQNGFDSAGISTAVVNAQERKGSPRHRRRTILRLPRRQRNPYGRMQRHLQRWQRAWQIFGSVRRSRAK